MRNTLFKATTLFFLLLFCSKGKATVYTIKIGTNYASLNNLCFGDTLRFVGDSLNGSAYGSVQGNVYNSQTQNYDNFQITSFTNIATSYDHILVQGDSSFFYNLGPFNALTDGNLYFNCLPTNITDFALKLNSWFYPNPVTFQAKLWSDKILNEATLIIYNTYGQEVKQIKNIYGQTIIFSRNNLVSGLYFYRLIQGNKIISANKFIIAD